MLAEESEPDVLQSIAVAFGHLFDVRAVQLLAPFRNNPSEDVRLAVVRGLSRHRNDLAISTLIEMSSDDDDDVRDWATFELGSMIETDTPEIRDALFARTTDTNEDAKAEALVGLARRKDERALALILEELTSDEVGLLALEAAEELADARLAPALISLKEGWEGEDDRHVRRLHSALLSCVPHGMT
jgi:HEAT repeat protein